ncbi:hypothetical protein ES703_11512 [subsurface metagenome]
MPFPNWIGRRRLWTKERVITALVVAANEINGPLPCRDAYYNRIKKGRLAWPTSRRVLEYFGSMARAWLAVGATSNRVSLKNIDWNAEEDLYLLENAGIETLKTIAAHLRRSYAAVRARLNKHFKIFARSNQGFLSAAELAKEYGCPYHRVRTALQKGEIIGQYDRVRNRWQVDLAKITLAAEEILRAPKRHSYKNSPPDLGNYYQRYGLMRKVIDDRVMVVSSV